MFKLNSLTKIAFYIIVIASPIQWLSIINIGSASVKYINLATIPMVLCLLFAEFRDVVIAFFRFNKLLITSFFLLMVINFIYTCFAATNLNTASNYILKNLSYLFYFILFGPIVIYRYKLKSFYKEIAVSNILCVLFFLLIAEVTFFRYGINFISELIINFLKGNSVKIRYDLFYKLFNAGGSDTDYQTSLRNTLLGVFIYINFTSLYSIKLCKTKFLKLINIFCVAFATFLILASTSRSNILALALGYLIFFCLLIYSGKFKLKATHFLFVLVIAFLIIIFLPTLQSIFQGSTSMIEDRLTKIEDDARWDLNAEALAVFASNPLLGKGSGAYLSDGHRVHNFILGAAYQAGVIGFLLSLIFYFGIFYKLFSSAYIVKSKTELFWLASVVCVPILRSMTSGNSGTMSIIEWFCLAFYFGIVMWEKQQQQEAQPLNVIVKHRLLQE